MTTFSETARRVSSSPFLPDPEPIIEEFTLDDLVSHDSYGVGRVVGADRSR